MKGIVSPWLQEYADALIVPASAMIGTKRLAVEEPVVVNKRARPAGQDNGPDEDAVRHWLELREDGPNEDVMDHWLESDLRGKNRCEVYSERESSELPEYRISGEEDEDMQDVEMRVVPEDDHSATLSEQGGEEPDGQQRISLEEFLVRESWIAWEQELRRAHHERFKAQAYLSLALLPRHVLAERLTEEEQTRYEIWKTRFVNRPAGFEEEMMEAGGFGLGE